MAEWPHIALCMPVIQPGDLILQPSEKPRTSSRKSSTRRNSSTWARFQDLIVLFVLPPGPADVVHLCDRSAETAAIGGERGNVWWRPGLAAFEGDHGVRFKDGSLEEVSLAVSVVDQSRGISRSVMADSLPKDADIDPTAKMTLGPSKIFLVFSLYLSIRKLLSGYILCGHLHHAIRVYLVQDST